MSVSILAAMALSSAVQAAPPSGLHTYQSLTITPNGDRVASVDSTETAGPTAERHGKIVVRDAKTGAIVHTIDPCPACRYTGLTWSPKGDALAFVATDRRDRTAAIDVSTKGVTRTVTTVKGLAETPRWSPDSARIAFLAVVGAHKEVGATQAGVAQVGEIGSIVDEQRLYTVSAMGGEARALSPADTWVYEYDWAPDGRTLVGTAAKGDGDNNWWVAKLIAVDAASGGVRIIASPKVQMNYPRVSPDGRSVAFIGGLMSDYGPIGGDLWSIPLAGGEATNLTPGYKGTFTSFVWRGPAIVATALIGANTAVTKVDPTTGGVTVIRQAPISLSAGDGKVSFADNGVTTAAVVQSFETAPYIAVRDDIGTGPVRALTHDNDHMKPNAHAVNVTWKSGGFDVQGWLLTPVSYDKSVKHPMITMVHGGPSSAVTPTYLQGGTVRDLLDHGYFVFQPNPRGSYGQGEAFTTANVKDFGGGDLLDINAGIDAVEKIAPVDEKRLGIMGHSYGGFMTMWTVTHSHRFKAAVAGAGIANWSSYYGENGIDQWMVPFFGATFYDDPAVYDRLSPIRTIKTATTPTFIYVGERDVECPAAQSLEFHHGLDAMGVPNSLVIFAGEGHGIRSPEHNKELKERTLGWFDKYLK